MYLFNAFGQRVFVGNALSGSTIEGESYWGSQPVAYYTTSPSQTQFQHQDWLGTERMRTTYSGAVEGSFSSLPFGDGFAIVGGTDTDAHHFAGLDLDYESNTGHAQFRNYSSAQGRWLAPDPYDGSYDLTNPQSLNRYAYVLNGPLSYTDPTGLYCPIHVQGCKQGVAGAGDGDLTIFNGPDSGAGTYSWATGGPFSSFFDSNGNFTIGQTMTGFNVDVGPGYLLSWGGWSTSAVNTGGASAAPNSGKPPVRQYPKTTLPGTNFCGPGPYGQDFNNLPTLNGTDSACRQHDICYGGANANALTTLNPFRQGATLSCDMQLCKAIDLVTPTSYVETADRQLISYLFGCN